MKTNFILIVLLVLAGCQQGIYETTPVKINEQVYMQKCVKFNTLFMHLDFSKLKWNGLEISDYDADAQEVDVKTPYGALKTE